MRKWFGRKQKLGVIETEKEKSHEEILSDYFQCIEECDLEHHVCKKVCRNILM